MKQKTLFMLWAGLFILCAGLGFIPEPSGAVSTALTVLSVIFFLPPALLLYQAVKTGDSKCRKLLCLLSATSLALTLLMLILNFLSPFWPDFLGTVLHYVLVIVSTPMIASGHWALSLFLWAFLLIASIVRK